MFMQKQHFLLIVMLIGPVAGCGLKGPLYQKTDTTEQPTHIEPSKNEPKQSSQAAQSVVTSSGT
jgi:predicted small lipoprotein YifL